MNFISAEELNQKITSNSGIKILDVRDSYEYDICEIGGIKIPMSEITDRISELDPNDNFAVMCRSGKRAEAVANLLEKEYQFTSVNVLIGGILGRIEAIDNSLEIY